MLPPVAVLNHTSMNVASLPFTKNGEAGIDDENGDGLGITFGYAVWNAPAIALARVPLFQMMDCAHEPEANRASPV